MSRSPSRTRDRSRSPHRTDTATEPGDRWRCNNCTMENIQGDLSCKKCRLVRGKERKDIFTEDWECVECSANNFSRRIDCYKCHARKPPVDPKHPHDWICLGCRGNNFSKRVDCFKCGEPKPRFISSRNPGEWDCLCGALNYSRRTDCYKCHKPKHIGTMGGGRGGSFDQHSNPYSRPPMMQNRLRSPTPDRGFRQRSPIRGYPGAGTVPERAPDVDPVTGQSEWTCPVCGVGNFYKRFDCYRCFEKKPDQEYDMSDRIGARSNPSEQRSTYNDLHNSFAQENFRPQPNVPLSIPSRAPPPKKRFPTDWICGECDGLNFSKRTDCFKCHAPKSTAEVTDGVDEPFKYSPGGEWPCGDCGGLNYTRRTDCYKCKADKPQAYRDIDRAAGITV